MEIRPRILWFISYIGRTRKLASGVVPKITVQTVFVGAVFLFVSFVMAGITLLENLTFMYTTPRQQESEPFPVSVFPRERRIIESPEVERYLRDEFAVEKVGDLKTTWIDRLVKRFAHSALYQNMASPATRTLVIWPGDRKEEVVDHFGDILGWTERQRSEFAHIVTENPITLKDGTFFPGKYQLRSDTGPTAAAGRVVDRFNREVYKRYNGTVENQIPLEEALILASLLEREADDFTQMREISGIIWNRRFNNMKLQLDATLQYIKGSDPTVPVWWPRVLPRDKFLDSPYNTYQNFGIPPAPIANPAATTILAVLNPIETDCFFYFHTDDGRFHCSVTYEEHRQKLINIYGRGR